MSTKKRAETACELSTDGPIHPLIPVVALEMKRRKREEKYSVTMSRPSSAGLSSPVQVSLCGICRLEKLRR
jgi:hypothetical protein